MEFLSKSGLSFFKSLLDLYFATKSYVNKAISTNTGKFWGTFNDLADLQEITGSNGDYAYVIVPDDYSTSYDRYKWQTNEWVYEYTVGGEAFDDDQWAAINSGITASDKARLNEISDNIGNNSISEMRSDIDANTSEIAEINEELGDIDAALANKANVDGYYESMAVGQADTLKGQVLIPNDAAFRTSGGSEDVDTGLAHLQSVHGNTVSWNQLVVNGNFAVVGSWNRTNLTYSVTNNIATIVPIDVNSALFQIKQILDGHTYLVMCDVNMSEPSNLLRLDIRDGSAVRIIGYSRSESGWQRIGGVVTANGSNGNGYVRIYYQDNVQYSIRRFMLIDLTLCYNGQNLPTTVEQFEADYERWFGKPLTYEPYNAGELIPAKTTALKTTGFNQWDEEWELGGINSSGVKIDATNRIRSKNYIKILADTGYYFKTKEGISSGDLFFYDTNKNFISALFNNGNKAFTTPYNATFCLFSPTSNYGTTYNHDICINLSWSGTRNGEYEPYEEHTLQLPLTTLTGKLNGTGESIVVFPDGMKKAGTIRDEIYISGGKTYAVKRVGSVDLGSLSWRVSGNYIVCNTLFPSSTNTYNNICSMYKTVPLSNLSFTMDKTLGIGNTEIYTRDTAYSDAATFKAAMSGVMLYYELATPLVYELYDFTLPQRFKVNDWGTEEQVHADGVASVPAILNSLYAVNAVDTLRRLPQNYISQESMDNFLAQLGAAMGGTWTKSFNTETDEFEFSFTQSASLMSVSNNEETNNEEES